MYLTGGSSILSYCDIFFAEKLNIPVEYFNPFQSSTCADRGIGNGCKKWLICSARLSASDCATAPNAQSN